MASNLWLFSVALCVYMCREREREGGDDGQTEANAQENTCPLMRGSHLYVKPEWRNPLDWPPFRWRHWRTILLRPDVHGINPHKQLDLPFLRSFCVEVNDSVSFKGVLYRGWRDHQSRNSLLATACWLRMSLYKAPYWKTAFCVTIPNPLAKPPSYQHPRALPALPENAPSWLSNTDVWTFPALLPQTKRK